VKSGGPLEVAILARGRGVRLHPDTATISGPLLRVSGRPAHEAP